MPKWEEIRASVSKAATQTVNVTQDIAGNTTMHIKLARLMSKRDEQFEKLGKLTYKQLKGEESYAEEIAAIISQIDTLSTQIAKQKAKIEEVKAQKAAEKAAKKEEKAARKAAEKQADENQAEACAEELKDIIDENISD